MPQLTLDQALQLAQQHLQSGRPAEAEQTFREIIAAVPQLPGAHNGLGEALQIQHRHAESLHAFEHALHLKPDYLRAMANRASALAYLGRADDAIAAYRQTLRHLPTYAEGHMSIANLLAGKQAYDAALAEFHQALAVRPSLPEAHFGIANILSTTGRREDAEASYHAALAQKPDFVEAWVNLGITLEIQRKFDQATEALRRAAQLRPTDAQIHFQLGNTLSAAGRHRDAAAAYLQAVRLNPAHADACNNLGIALRYLGQLDPAANAFRQAVQSRPTFAAAWSNLAVVLDLKGERDEGLACHRHAVEADPTDPGSHDNLLYALHFHPRTTPEQLLKEHQAWNRRHAAPLSPSAAELASRHLELKTPSSELKRLRIGYVSPDFRDHPVGRFMLPLIAAHDPAAVEILCYADVLTFDDISKKIHKACHGWRDITGMSDEQVAHLVRLDHVDILVDLTMHMTGNRLLAFARKPAPIQVTYLAYPSSTGMTAIDYRLSDRHLDPEPAADWYTEKTLYLDSYWCYAAPPEAPEPNALPSTHTDTITFGCLNGFGKVSDDALRTWAQILLAVPNSRLLLHANPGSHRDRTLHFLDRLGIDPARCQFLPLTTLAGYFQNYHQIDIALDPFPYAGG
ncbi:MAG TPA: tetratricopeptide repeat protein, partial [Phycisphaerae bacterium]|nr:tetratricopeptide repeat protein [Phycisphaerae bacterium]